MIDIKLIKKNFDWVERKLHDRNVSSSLIKKLTTTIQNLNSLQTEEENLNKQRNERSKKISMAYTLNKQSEANELQREMYGIKEKLNNINERLKKQQAEFSEIIVQIPNFPDDSVPLGVNETDNKVLFASGEKPKFDFVPKPHWELAESLELVDFEMGPKISGTRFVVYQKLGAQLFEALAKFTLDYQVNVNGYVPYSLPVIIDEHAMYNSCQLPKFKDEAFEIKENKYLSPTAEVQLINLFANKILLTSNLPMKLTSNSLCFRREAGAAGRDTRGLIRLHQFKKTELVIICAANDSSKQLEIISENAQSILKALKLAYQVITLCTGDLGFASAKTYDLEVWLPSDQKYREISSCSNTLDFQARHAMIRHRNKNTEKANYVHTLNGSGVAIDRLFAAILENYQQADGSVLIPEKLQPYMNGLKIISKPQKNSR